MSSTPPDRELVATPGPTTALRRVEGDVSMVTSTTPQAETLRKAIEGLIDAKLHDALARPGGLDRLVAHRRTGVASYDIRNAERNLEQTLAAILSGSEAMNG
jgi:hypothetical protein